MSSPKAKEYNLLQHLRFLFKFLNLLGLTGISFNESNQRFERPTRKQTITKWVYRLIKYFSGLFLFGLIFYYLRMCLTSLKSVGNREDRISLFSSYIHTISAFVYASHYFRIQSGLLKLFNEVLGIAKKLRARTGSKLFFSPTIAKVLFLKSIILAFIMKNLVFSMLLTLWLAYFYFIQFTLFPIINMLMFFGYFYIQLILVCFYWKMNEYLISFGDAMEQRELEKCVHQFLAISRRIRRFTRRLNGFASSVFMCSYMGLFHDIEFTNRTLRNAIFSKHYTDYTQHWFHLNALYSPSCLSFIFDMFIIGLLSDMLEGANDKFQALIVRLSGCTPALQRDVEVMLIGDNTCGLGLRAFGQVKVNQKFSFDFMFKTVLGFVLVNLHMFAAKEMLLERSQKLTRNFFYDL